MANQYLQKFSTVAQIPTDKGNAAGLGVVDGAIVLRGSSTPGSFGNTLFNSAADDKTIRLNSRTYVTATSGDIIGFQSKPRLASRALRPSTACRSVRRFRTVSPSRVQ